MPQRVALPTGVELDYTDSGDPAGVPVLMLHGYSDSRRSFDPLLAELPASLRALAVSQRGHGDSGRPDRDYGPEAMARDAVAFLDAMDIDAAILLGHSAGTVAAQAIAVDHPGRALGLVLIGASRTFHGNPGLLELWETAVADLRDPVAREFVHEFQAGTAVRPLPPGYLDVVVEESLKLPARVWRSALRDLLDAPAPTDRGDVGVPAVVLWGERDDLCSPAEQAALVPALGQARLEVFEGTGHSVHWEEPARVAALVAAFVGEVAGVRA